MALPLTYNIRNVLVRWRSTLATIIGMTLVVGAYIILQSIPQGIEKASRNTGDPRNVLIVRKGSPAESGSQVTLEQVRQMQYWSEIARDSQGRPLFSADVLVLINLPRKSANEEANVLVRGISPVGMQLRPQVTLVEGNWFTPGRREVVVSRSLASRFANFELGNHFKTAGRELTVVGWMDGGNSAFDSEIWMDADECRAIFDREFYSSVLVRATSDAAIHSLTNRFEKEKALPLRGQREVGYYAGQTKTATPLKWIGRFLAVTMSIGAVFAAMNTMYAAVAARTREIGTLRVLGFRRRSILLSLMVEGVFLSLLGGILGCFIAGLFPVVMTMLRITPGTMSFETFSEVIFQFQITPRLMVEGLIFSVIVGLVGSLLPAVRASRLPVIAALKAL